jgi:uncharacterized membrane protein YeaQ/YmgE (transglycosylase-associated protein family)
MWDLLAFALIGLLVGAAARMFYPGRQPVRTLDTLVLGLVGALGGGMTSWIYWPADRGFHIENYLLSILGSMLVIVLWSAWAYARSVSDSRSTSP